MEPLGSEDPRQVGEYRLLRRLGAGGMGRVYLGRTAGGRTVAVKVVRGELADDGEFRARFRQEVAAARLVGGEWTAPVLDADTESERPWVATGYVAGPALGTAVREFGPLPEPAVHTLGAGLARALAHVHGLGTVHRDVKPSNVLLTFDGPRLIDFGIARALDAATALTRSGYVVGSPGFMSPEQAQGTRAGAPSDVFSLGAVLAYAATGAPPFGEGVSAAVLLYRVLHEEPDLHGLDGGLREIVLGCLAKDPAARPTPAELLALLDAEEAGEAATGRSGQGGWLPPALAAAVGRSAVELLHLDSAEPAAPTGPAAGGPATAARAVGAAREWTPTQADAPSADAPSADAPARGRRRARTLTLGALAVLLAAFGGLKLYQGLGSGDGGDTARGGATPCPSVSTSVGGVPAAPALGPASTCATGAATTAATDGPPPSPATTTAVATTGAAATGSGGPSVIPPAFLGVWRGDMTTTDTHIPAGTTTITVRPAAIGAETTTSVNSVESIVSVSCEGAWTLKSVSAKELVFQSRLVRSSPAGFCTNGSTRETLTLRGDGTIRFGSADPPAGNPVGVMSRAG
ncbi:serine/threonine-protein kinase [Kitasatospora sp. NPDC050543]|uniref:serine/threonine-protein kinase n=1 Tax=Kitasatospora sp. NPDC050543 TaxID=3364054 RepID=UPI0037AF6416